MKYVNRSIPLRILLSTVVGLFSLLLTAQNKNKDDVKLRYSAEYSGGAIIHTNGFGANFRYGQFLNAKSKRLWTAELVNMKHPKEQRSYNPFFENAKSYHFGKLNSMWLLRAQFGFQNTLFAKELKKSIEINYIITGGPTLAFLKPIYLEVQSPAARGSRLSTERYDPERHSLNNIYGRAGYLTGLSETSIYPGLSLKFALNFEYAPEDEILRSVEVGANFDAFHKEIEVMAFEHNNQFWLTLYANILIGKKML